MEKLHAHGPYRGDDYSTYPRYVHGRKVSTTIYYHLSCSCFSFRRSITVMITMPTTKNNTIENHRLPLICRKHSVMLRRRRTIAMLQILNIIHRQTHIDIGNIGEYIQ
jgi:hypothetical protein